MTCTRCGLTAQEPQMIAHAAACRLRSPEDTGHYECAGCGNTTRFIGHVLIEINQPFTVISQDRSEPAGPVIDYASSEDDNKVIGLYNRITCAKCGQDLWRQS